MSYKLAGVIWNDDGTTITKKLSPLEHLEFIRNYEIDDEHRTLNMNYACKQSLDVIETALLKKVELELTSLKALKIIAEKKVDIGLLIRCLNAYCIDSACQEYNQWTQEEHLIYEECVLLKKVLNNEAI